MNVHWLTALTSTLAMALAASVAVEAAQPLRGLMASGPYAEHAAERMLFGRLVGNWNLEIEYQSPDGGWLVTRGEWHFGWILQGRAIQDVWISREPDDPSRLRGYGVTIRVYDPAASAWHVQWIGVLNHSHLRFLAKAVDDEIVMNATDDEGNPFQWIFSNITPMRFEWRAQDSADGGRTWTVRQRMVAVRSNADGAPPIAD
jgi:hypothetical protein